VLQLVVPGGSAGLWRLCMGMQAQLLVAGRRRRAADWVCDWPRPCPAGATAAISCIGGFGNHDQMRRVNGTANAVAIAAARAAGIPRFALVGAHIPPLPGFDVLAKGYVEGKRIAEDALFSEYPHTGDWRARGQRPWWGGCIAVPTPVNPLLSQRQQGHSVRSGLLSPSARTTGQPCSSASLSLVLCGAGRHALLPVLSAGVVVRPWVIYGDRVVSSHTTLPLGAVFGPVELLLKQLPNGRQLAALPIVGAAFIPPVRVEAVAKAVVQAATDDSVAGGVIDTWRLSSEFSH
jgi:hypothetical protein